MAILMTASKIQCRPVQIGCAAYFGVDRREIMEHLDAHRWAISRPEYDAEWWLEFEEVSITMEPDPSEVPFQGALETFCLIVYGKVTDWGYKPSP